MPAEKVSSLKKELRLPGSGDSAKRESLKIAAVYSAAGCAWILLTDILEGQAFSADLKMVTISVVKGLLCVLSTAFLIYGLTYPPLRKVLDSRREIERINRDLEKTSQSYQSLCEEFEKKQSLLKSLINSTPDLIFYKDPNCVYFGCNRAFELFAGRTENEIIGLTDFDLFPRREAEIFREKDLEMLKTHAAIRNEGTVPCAGGKTVSLDTLKSPCYDTDGNIIGLIGVSRDISERKAREERIQYLSYHDLLTGLHNRTFLMESLKRLDKTEYLPLSVIIGDVNGMKLINDAFGHAEGDTLLKTIADVLRECSRPGDIVARIGGDEFSILLPNTDTQTAKSAADRILAACRERRLEKSMISPDIALGYATREDNGVSFDETIILAEDLMYRRKLLEQKSLHNSVLASIKTTMFEKSSETGEHAGRIAALSRELGRAVGLSAGKLDELELVATLHDIGKISIDKEILTKGEKLSDEEWREIRKHPETGYRIANSCPDLRHIADYILCHHERWDGSGYPQGLSGEQIPLISRIISITDTFDAITQDRAYRKALPQDYAIDEIIHGAGTQFDPGLVSAFVKIVRDRA